MNVELIRVNADEARELWQAEVAAFQGLYAKYQDHSTNPAAEPLEKIITRLEQPFTYYYWIKADGAVVGGLRVVDMHEPNTPKRISPLFITEKFRGNGYAQAALRLAEGIHGATDWRLETILQEKGNCYLYEKMGYRKTGESEVINERMTLVHYSK